jgi:hypothetical protein
LRPLLAAATLLPCLLQAQTGAPVVEAPWLQMEVVVFRHLDTALAADERWPAKPELGYPPDLGYLIDPGSPAHAAALAERELAAALAAEDATPGSAVSVASAPGELPRLRLGGSDLLLADAAARIAGSRQYRLLAHHAWRQPVPTPAHAEHVLVTGGAGTGDHFELEGFLTLTRSRFWHVETRLWLNDFPAPGDAPGDAAVVLPAVPHPPLPTISTNAAPAPGVDEASGLDSGIATSAAQTIAVEPARPLRTVVLQAARRMNPGELHYLDHPLFGVLLMIRPYDPNAPLATEPAPAGDLSTPPSAATAPAAQ